MLGKYPHRETVTIFVVANSIRLARDRASLIKQRLHQVGLPNRINALHKRQDSFEARTSVNRWLGQRGTRPVWRLIKLHEDQVPELHKTIAGGITQWATIRAKRRTAIDMDFATRPTRTSFTHLPVVVFVAEALDSIHRNADDLMPHCLSLVVGLMHGDP